jgi:hypothetical protein
MERPKPIYILKGNTPYLGRTEIASHDVKSLQIILTDWLKANGSGFIFRMWP